MGKKSWVKPDMQVIACDLSKLNGDVKSIPEAELIEQLKNCGCLMPTVYYASKKYLLREIAGEYVLVTVGDGVADFCGIVTLNKSAAVLWKALEKGATKAELKAQLTEQFPVSEQMAAEDVDKALNLLRDRGMVTYEPEHTT